MIAIVDYGLGNVGSIRNMLARMGHEALIAGRGDMVKQASRLILPGIGAFDEGMGRLKQSGLLPVILDRVLKDGVPLLGICLGMQLLFEASEEGRCAGLCLLPGRCERIRPPMGFKIPHMGWNVVRASAHPLFQGLEQESRFYFVHSFSAHCRQPEQVVAETDYGVPLVAAVAAGNVMGVQFHPEKSHRFGMRLLSNFAGPAC